MTKLYSNIKIRISKAVLTIKQTKTYDEGGAILTPYKLLVIK